MAASGNHFDSFIFLGINCGGNFVSSDNLQIISTSNQLNNYPNNQNCYWIINPNDGKEFEVILSDGETERNVDFVEVFMASKGRLTNILP